MSWAQAGVSVVGAVFEGANLVNTYASLKKREDDLRSTGADMIALAQVRMDLSRTALRMTQERVNEFMKAKKDEAERTKNIAVLATGATFITSFLLGGK